MGKEQDYKAIIAGKMANEQFQAILTVKCPACSAEITSKPNITDDECPFCASSNSAGNKSAKKMLKPNSILPFKIEQKQVQQQFSIWLGTLWFAPDKLKKFARQDEGLSGIYLPYLTYDTRTESSYTGKRGDDYYTSETYETEENGKKVTRTRQIKNTKWCKVSGKVRNNFADVLVISSNSLPREYAQQLEPWDLFSIVAYDEKYLSGFRVESYQLSIEEGFEIARESMADDIALTIKEDIGGDQQQITTIKTSYEEITFKYILLPVWISAYRFEEKVYRIMINARTGEVLGERPDSKIKIILAVLLVLILLAALIYFKYNQPVR